MKKRKIAVIAGDGIGNEVMPEGLRAVEAAARKFNLNLEFVTMEWANCDYYLKHGQMMPSDWFEQLKDFDAIYFGAAGWPDKVPDHISLWGSLIKFRRDFDEYVNLRVRWPTSSPATSIFTWCAKTPRANIRRSAVACTQAPSAKWCCRKRFFRATAPTAS